MKGNLIKYIQDHGVIKSEHVGIAIDYKEGYHIRKSWNDEETLFVDDEMIRIHWLNCPSALPETAKYSIMSLWNSKSQQDLFEANVIISEWDELDDEWFFACLFEVDSSD